MSNQPPSGPEPQQPYGPPPQQPYGQPPQQPYGSPQQPYGQPTPPAGPGSSQPPTWGTSSPTSYGQQGYSPIPGGPGGAPAGPPGPVPPQYQPSYGQIPPPGGQIPPPGGPVPPRKSGVPKVALIVGAGVLVLILGVVTAAVLLNRGSTPSTGQTAGTSAPVPETTKASDAVKGYLDALAAGRAEAALAFGKDQPTDKTFLTDAVLSDSLKRAPVTEINVPEVTDDNAYQVTASYKLGGQSVSENFYVSKEGDQFRLSSTTQDLDLASVRSNTVPMLINNVPVTADKVTLLPGSYALTTGIANISYGAKSTIVVTSPNDYPAAQPTPTLTKAGSHAFVKAAEATMASCLKQHNLAPKGCPFAIRASSGQKINQSSVRWKLTGDPWRNLKPRLDYQDPAIAQASAPMTFEVTARGTQNGTPTRFGPQKVYEYVQMQGDVTKSPVKVTFE